MDYYRLLQLDREPFSNSPDPEYFYPSKQHLACLQKLELALRLKRGLNVVIGDVGTGKTTLCRQLIRTFADEAHIESHLILDPSFDSTTGLLEHLHALICEESTEQGMSELALKDGIQQELFNKGVNQDKTVVLIIDEGQKITEPCLEILRELLNYETNTHKLLQIIIFAQLEFEDLLERHANFSDRINLLHYLAPMDFKDTRRMVKHRIKLSSVGPRPRKLFTKPAFWAIYRASQGYPRKIIHLCHQSVLAMIIQNRTTAGWSLIRSCKNRLSTPSGPQWRMVFAVMLVLFAATAWIAYQANLFHISGRIGSQPSGKMKHLQAPDANAMQMDADRINPTLPEIITPQHNPGTIAEPEPVSPDITDASRPLNVFNTGDRQDTGQLNAPTPIDPKPAEGRPQEPIQEQVHTPPSSLGKLIVKPGDTLVSLMEQVYGTQRNAILRAVIEANAQFADPNVIDIGNVVTFPPLPSEIRHPEPRPFWISLGEHTALAEAVQQAHNISHESQIPVRVIPHWSSNRGMKFELLIKKLFSQRQGATDYADGLPTNYTGTGQVMTDWPDGTIFYADPYFGLKR